MNILNIAKWELVKRTSLLNVIFAIYIVLLLMVMFLAETGVYELYSPGFVRSLGTTIRILLICTMGYIMFLFPTLSITSEMRSKNFVLEKMRTEPFLSTALVRITISVLWVSLAWGLLILATKISNDEYRGFLGIGFSDGAKLVFYSAILSPVIAMFAFTAGLSIRRWSALSLIFSFVFYIVLGTPFIFMEMGSSIPSLATFAIGCVSAIVLLLAACWLYDNKCEIADV